MMNRRWTKGLAGAAMMASLALVSCSGGGDSVTSGGGGGGGDAPAASSTTGKFVDSPVQGLRYSTPTQFGFTLADGSFNYLPGETVTFFLGQNTFGPVTAAPQITPWTVFGPNMLPSDQRAINLTRVLLSLDNTTGTQTITLGPAVNNAVGQMNFDQHPAAFGADPAVTEFLASASATSPLVSEQTATAHLQGQFAYMGSWSDQPSPSASPNELFVITFLPDGTFITVNHDTADPDLPSPGKAGMERGTITYDSQTGNFTWTVITNADGASGLSLIPQPGNVQLSGNPLNTLTVLFPNEPNPDDRGPYTLFRVIDPNPQPNPIVGSWVGKSPDNPNAPVVITFFTDNTFAFVEDNDPALSPGGQDGIERGTYTFNQQTGALSGTVTLDTNGGWGLHDTGPLPSAWGSFTVTFNGIDTVTVNTNIQGDPPITLTRVRTP